MDELTDPHSNKEDLSTDIDCDNTNCSMISDMKSDEYNFDVSNSNSVDSFSKLKSTIEEDKEQEDDEDDLFDADMEGFDTTDFMKGSPLSENLELEKIMEQLNDTIQQDIFASEGITGNNEDGDSNEGSFKENDSSLENISELNLLNNDIISYINSDEGTTIDNIKDTCDNLIKDLPVTTIKKKYKAAPQHLIKKTGENNDTDIINLINKELDNTLQFTNTLCHYVYSDVIVGKDFFKLFCSETVKTDTKIIETELVDSTSV